MNLVIRCGSSRQYDLVSELESLDSYSKMQTNSNEKK